MIKCLKKEFVQKIFHKMPLAYKKQMKKAVQEVNEDRICFDTDSQGWRSALNIVKNIDKKQKETVPKKIEKQTIETNKKSQTQSAVIENKKQAQTAKKDCGCSRKRKNAKRK